MPIIKVPDHLMLQEIYN